MSRTYADFEQWRAGIEADGLVVSPEGQLRFSAARREELRILFGLAGIDIATIRTMKQCVRYEMRSGRSLLSGSRTSRVAAE